MRAVDGLLLTAERKQLQAELADRLQHGTARLVGGLGGWLHQALVHQAHERSESAAGPLEVAYLLRRIKRPAPDEDAEPAEEPPLRLLKQVVAPANRRAQRLLALRQVARPVR